MISSHIRNKEYSAVLRTKSNLMCLLKKGINMKKPF